MLRFYKWLAVIVIAACLSGEQAQSADLTEVQKSRISDLSLELTQCYAYYSLMSGCAGRSDSSEGRTLSEKSQVIAQRLMPIIYQSGKLAGLVDAALLGRIQFTLDSMRRDIKDNCANIAALYLKYGQSCKSLYENTEERFRAALRP